MKFTMLWERWKDPPSKPSSTVLCSRSLGPRERQSREMGKNRVRWSHKPEKVSHYRAVRQALPRKGKRRAQRAVQEHVRGPSSPLHQPPWILLRGFAWVRRVETNGQAPGKANEERGSEPSPDPPLLPRLAGASCPSRTPLPPPLPLNTPVLTPAVLPKVPKALRGAKANQFPSSLY